MTDPGPAMLFSPEAVAAMDDLARWVRREIAARSLEIARADGRALVNQGDVCWAFAAIRPERADVGAILAEGRPR